MTLHHSGNLSIGDVIPQAKYAFRVLALLNAQLDATLYGALGVSLGSLQAELSAQLQAAVQASVNVGLTLTNPILGFQLAVAASAALVAQLQAAIAGGLPVVGVNVSANVAANAALIASLQAKLGALNATIEAVVNLKAQIVIVDLTPGPVALYWWDPQGDTPTLTSVGGKLSAEFSSPTNQAGIAPGSASYGIVLVTQVPAAWTVLARLFKTSLRCNSTTTRRPPPQSTPPLKPVCQKIRFSGRRRSSRSCTSRRPTRRITPSMW